MPPLTEYTVLTLVPDYLADSYGQDTRLFQLQAQSAPDACSRAQQRAMLEYYPCESDRLRSNPDDFAVLFVTAGYHENLLTKD